MFATSCPGADQLQAYAVGRLPEETSESIAQHLDTCAECQAAIATLDDADDTFVAALKQPPAGDPIVEESQCDVAIARAVALDYGQAAVRSNLEHTTFSRIGDELGEYRLLEEIGRGGMGRVYRALQTKLDRIVALKVLPGNRADDHRAIARFEREMKAIGRLYHSNIVHAYDAREIDGKPVLIMEFVEGLDLARVLHSLGRVKPADACELIRQAALGLQYAHENGLVHRDVKPGNLILTPDGNVKLLDLGLARFEQTSPGDEMTGAGQPMGTADYMAPEQVSDARSADIRADIYSLGCTLYKLITGHAPFSNPDCRGTFDKLTSHVNDPAPSLRDYDPALPDGLVRLIDRMLAKSPDDRPATPADVASALTPHCSGSDLAELESMAAHAEQQQSTSRDRNIALPPRHAASICNKKRPPVAVRWAGWVWGLIGAFMLLAGAGGFALGVFITIERNGKKTSLEVPDGSNVAIGQNGGVNVKLPSDSGLAVNADRSDFEAIQGVWQVIDRKGKSPGRSNSLLHARQSVNPDGTNSQAWKTSRIEFDGKRMRIVGAHESPTSYEYQINPSESPKMIDVFVRGDALLGVYELSGDQLKVCLDWSGGNRPQAVWAGLKRYQEMLVLRRVGPLDLHPDVKAIQGTWVFESAWLKMKNLHGGTAVPAPQGEIAPGRQAIITPGEFIIKGEPLAPHSGLTAIQPKFSDQRFDYAIDGTRRWISFSFFTPACPGIYRLDNNHLVIRLSDPSRPVSIDASPGDQEVVLRLKRPDSTTQEKPKGAAILKPGESQMYDAMAAALIKNFDDNDDGSLSANEWPREEGFRQFTDADGDGNLTRTEFAAILKTHIEQATKVIAKYDENKDGVLTASEWSSMTDDPSHADVDKNGRLTPFELADTSLKGVALAHQLVAVNSLKTFDDVVRYLMERLDLDNNGTLSANEWPHEEGFRRFLDTDGGEYISRRDLMDLLNKLSKEASEFVDYLDTNGDGWVSESEWSTNRPSNGPFIDVNSDGRMTPFDLTVLRFENEEAFSIMKRQWKPATVPPSKPPPANPSKRQYKTMLIMVDALGSVTIQIETTRMILGSSLDEVTKTIQKQIAEYAITHVELRSDSTASKSILSALQQMVKQKKLQSYNVRGGGVPMAPAQIDFRIAAVRASSNRPGLSNDEIEQLIELKKNPQAKMASGSLASQYRWVEIDYRARSTMTENRDGTIRVVLDNPYLLVSTERESTMLASDKGDRAWKITRAKMVEGDAGEPVVSLELNEAGGRLLGKLTATHRQRPLAILINNRVFMVPRIMGKITDRVQITGDFRSEFAKQLVRALGGAAGN